MALSHCPACGGKISYRDPECPWCGAPTDRSPALHSEPVSGESVSPVERRGWTQRGPFGFLRRHWNGEYSLARSYWINHLLVSLFAPGLGLVLFPLVADRPARFSAGVALLLTALVYAAWIWAVRGTWVSATRHTAAGGGWGGIAKLMIVLGAFGVAGRLAGDRGRLGEQWATLLGKQLGPQYTLRVSRDRASLEIRGGMNDGAAAALAKALDRAPTVKTVVFDSGGGWVREGRLVAGVISRRGLATHVDGQCSSACTLAFLAGKERTIGPRGRLGFHQVRSIGRSDDWRSLDVEETRAIYRGAGLPDDFVERVMATPPKEMWYPTSAELLAAHVITRRTEWDAARADLTPELRAGLETSLKGIHVPDGDFRALLDCEVTAYIQWLNTTNCAYLYDQATTSLDEHSKEQDACLERADSAARLRDIDLACTKAKLPDEWSTHEDLFAKRFAGTTPAARR